MKTAKKIKWIALAIITIIIGYYSIKIKKSESHEAELKADHAQVEIDKAKIEKEQTEHKAAFDKCINSLKPFEIEISNLNDDIKDQENKKNDNKAEIKECIANKNTCHEHLEECNSKTRSNICISQYFKSFPFGIGFKRGASGKLYGYPGMGGTYPGIGQGIGGDIGGYPNGGLGGPLPGIGHGMGGSYPENGIGHNIKIPTSVLAMSGQVGYSGAAAYNYQECETLKNQYSSRIIKLKNNLEQLKSANVTELPECNNNLSLCHEDLGRCQGDLRVLCSNEKLLSP